MPSKKQAKKIGKKKKSNKSIQREMAAQMLTLATSGFGLVAALAWNSLIQEFVASYIKKWLPQGGGILTLLIYALIVTVLAVTVTYQLSKLNERLSN
jgi:hypothetical protein